ncbi:MAG: DUF1330 domain-containing protein [Thermoleophilia bacterium]
MPAYLIVDVDLKDMDAYRESGYLTAVPEIAAKHGGRYIVRGGELVQLEGSWMPKRLVIVEFPDMESLQAFHSSEEYAPYLAIRNQLATSHAIAVQGL